MRKGRFTGQLSCCLKEDRGKETCGEGALGIIGKIKRERTDNVMEEGKPEVEDFEE